MHLLTHPGPGSLLLHVGWNHPYTGLRETRERACCLRFFQLAPTSEEY